MNVQFLLTCWKVFSLFCETSCLNMSTLAYRLLIKSNSNCFPLKMKMVTIILSLLAATAAVVWTVCHIQLRTIWKLNMDMTSSWTKHGWHQIFIEITRRETFLLWSSLAPTQTDSQERGEWKKHEHRRVGGWIDRWHMFHFNL